MDGLRPDLHHDAAWVAAQSERHHPAARQASERTE
jgi:hypothetical protein